MDNPTSTGAVGRRLGDIMAREVTEAQQSLAVDRQVAVGQQTQRAAQYLDTLAAASARSLQRMTRTHGQRGATLVAEGVRAATAVTSVGTAGPAAALAYLTDRAQRMALVLDLLRERGNQYLAHEAAGCPPVLSYDYAVVMDGRDLPRPCCYMLLQILPPPDCPTVDCKRPYVIIDPRAGHGPGIGGFKHDSQVGVALRKGHPVYFVAFRPQPEPGQTIADVTAAEAEFVRAVMRRHPDSSKPIVIGNCQGGWATALLAATNPDLTGPVVFNGAPMAYWSGRVGENPMRYNGGLLGGVLPAMLMADFGGGKFDGAWLVTNFEMLNPSRNFLRQYLDLFDGIDDPQARRKFLEFQKWWGGYFSMNAAEIEWIVSQLFVGNRLASGEASLAPGLRVDLRNIRAPIIVFASHGDNITPPQQALNWILDLYSSEQEIKLCGQRIIYMVHRNVGHLGIFVSSSIARREHAEMGSTMKTIEALAPGLYEMTIEDTIGHGDDAHFVVAFHQRKLADIAAHDDGRSEEGALAAVARASEAVADVYDATLRPVLRAVAQPAAVEVARQMQPLRVQRWSMADGNPWLWWVPKAAAMARADRQVLGPSNPFAAVEAVWAGWAELALDVFRDSRDMMAELTFHALWGHPSAIAFGASRARHRDVRDALALRQLPEVVRAMGEIDRGGFAAAVVRMLILLAEARGSVRRDRLDRSSRVLTHDSPFAELGPEARVRLIQDQSVICQIDPDGAIATLPKLLPDPDDRDRALAVVAHILGPREEMEEHTVATLARLHAALRSQGLEDTMMKAAE